MTNFIIEGLLVITAISTSFLPSNSRPLSAEAVVQKIKRNLSEFNKYGEAMGLDKPIHDFVSTDISIESFDGVQDGLLVSFDEEPGYLTIGDDETIYDINFDIPAPFSEYSGGKLVYVSDFGYRYVMDSGEICHYADEQPVAEENIFGSAYSGQTSEGEGTITAPNTYISSRYGTGYSYDDVMSLTTPSPIPQSQWDLSVYTTNGSSEGNCGLVSAYTLLNFLARGTYSDIDYSSTATYDPKVSEATLYNSKKDEAGVTVHTNVFTNLYIAARGVANTINGSPEDLTVFQSSAIIEQVLEANDHTVNAIEEVYWQDFIYNLFDEFVAGRPLLWSTDSSVTYGSHTMAAFGYKHFKKTTYVLGIKIVSGVTLLQICDGWSSSSVYFDLRAYANKASHIGAFVRIAF